jgi:hypothetical protein
MDAATSLVRPAAGGAFRGPLQLPKRALLRQRCHAAPRAEAVVKSVEPKTTMYRIVDLPSLSKVSQFRPA